MLTKQERAAIAERAEKFDFLNIDKMYKVFFGESLPITTTYQEDREAVADRLIKPCDTSNMIELPIDKDGEVIRQEVKDTFKELDELHEAQSIVLKRIISSMDECIASLDRLIEALNDGGDSND